MSDRSLGGDGSLNLPYEDVPGGPVPSTAVIATGVMVAAVVFQHPLTGEPHPGVQFRFFFPTGAQSEHAYVALLEIDELRNLATLVQEAVDGAFRYVEGR